MISNYAYKVVCRDLDRFGKRAVNVRLDSNARPQYTREAGQATLFETGTQAQAVADGLAREDQNGQYDTRSVLLEGGETVVPDPRHTQVAPKPVHTSAKPAQVKEDPKETATSARALVGPVVKRGRDRFCYHCGEPTRGGNYLPGHDSKHLSILVADIKNKRYTLHDVLESLQLPRTAIRGKLVKRVADVAEQFDRDDLRAQVEEYTK